MYRHSRALTRGGGPKSGMLDRADRRLSHSGIFFRRGEFSKEWFCAGPPLASIVRFRSAQRLRKSSGYRCPSGQAQCAFHCTSSISSRALENFDLFYGAARSPGGASQTLERCEPGPVG